MAAMCSKLHGFIGLGQHKTLSIVSLIGELCHDGRDGHGNGRLRLRACDKCRKRCGERF